MDTESEISQEEESRRIHTNPPQQMERQSNPIAMDVGQTNNFGFNLQKNSGEEDPGTPMDHSTYTDTSTLDEPTVNIVFNHLGSCQQNAFSLPPLAHMVNAQPPAPRDPRNAPTWKLTVDLLKTYKTINQVFLNKSH
jgi:hypothetical protein